MKTTEKYQAIFGNLLRSAMLMLVALLVVTLFLAVSGYETFAIFKGLGRAFTKDIAGSIRWATPMILAGLAVCVPFKAGVFNLGVDGQIYMGATAGTAVALLMPPGSGFIGLLLAFLAAMLAGALFALIPAVLKIYLHADIVVTTLLLNFVGMLLCEAMVSSVMRDPNAAAQMNASKMLPEDLWLPRIEAFGPSSASIGIFFAIAAALVIAFVFQKTTLGYEITLVGTNPNFASYGGIRPGKITMQVMMISGALGGILGISEVTAIQHRLIAGFNLSLGFDGIVVSLLANNNPLGILISGTFFGALKNSGINMERITDVPQMVTQIVMAIIILSITANIALPRLKRKKEAR